jgi:hypothetical protein
VPIILVLEQLLPKKCCKNKYLLIYSFFLAKL